MCSGFLHSSLPHSYNHFLCHELTIKDTENIRQNIMYFWLVINELLAEIMYCFIVVEVLEPGELWFGTTLLTLKL